MSNPRSQPNVILVEGSDDLYAVQNLLNHSYERAIQPPVANMVGYQNLRKELQNVIDVEVRERVGIVVDADDNLLARWQSLGDRLAEIGDRNFPRVPPHEGAILDFIRHSDGKPLKVGIWIMPDNQSAGCLEDFAEKLIMHPNPLWELARQSVNTIPADLRLFGENNAAVQKAYVHTWLAWQEDPRLSIGAAIKEGRTLDPKAPLAAAFITWVRLLFNLPLP